MSKWINNDFLEYLDNIVLNNANENRDTIKAKQLLLKILKIEHKNLLKNSIKITKKIVKMDIGYDILSYVEKLTNVQIEKLIKTVKK